MAGRAAQAGAGRQGGKGSPPHCAKTMAETTPTTAEVESAPVATAEVLKGLVEPLVVDARDPNEVAAQKGGPAIEGSVNVPFNIEGLKQSERPTSADEYIAKLQAAAFLPEDKGRPIITHCGAGGRGGKCCTVLVHLGYTNVHNGGSPDNIRTARQAAASTAAAAASQEVESAPVASAEVLKGLVEPLVVDARDPNEIAAGKGGPAIEGSVNVPFNIDGIKQSEHPTSAEEYTAKLQAAGVLPEEKGKAIITHCGAGGRGGKCCTVISSLGYTNVYNGGSPDNIRAARQS